MAPGTHHVGDRGLNVALQFIRGDFHPRSRVYNGTSREGFIPSRFAVRRKLLTALKLNRLSLGIP